MDFNLIHICKSLVESSQFPFNSSDFLWIDRKLKEFKCVRNEDIVHVPEERSRNLCASMLQNKPLNYRDTHI